MSSSSFELGYSSVIRHSDFVIFPHMTPARLQTTEEIFHAALDQEPDQIGVFLDTACEGDDVLRRKVEALLSSHQRAGAFIETPVAGIATRIIENGQADLLVDRTIGHYKISKRIGTGGMGEVYLATDVTAGRKAALKLLPERFTGDAERLKRFQQEAHALVGLNHPNILTVYEIGEDHSTHYIASELIEGETLRQRLTRGRMEVGEAVDVAIQVASAVAAAHEAGIVHRDIKPENIMLRPDGYVKVLDFGIAKLAEQEVPITITTDEALLLVETNLGSILGTVRYMSPEQARGAPVDKRTDIWSLGVILYEMVTGYAPFTGETPGEAMSSILEMEPPPLTSYVTHTSAELQQIISKTLRKERDERYQSAHELLEALQSFRRSMEFKTALERSTRAPSWLRWTRLPIALVLGLLVAAFAVAFPFYWHRNPTRSSIPEKSVAVLPFENFSDNKENSYFGAAVQDEVLANLAKIADLKVISRTSVMQYKSDAARNLREIGEALGVAHVVEGSVQRVANRVRVSAQLIDARTDAHLWAETYDRDVADVFAIQTEIAQAIANQLQAKLSPAEKSAIEERPTKDLAAYDLYRRACVLYWGGWSNGPNGPYAEASFFEAASLLDQAITRDPEFFLAYCQLARTHDALYFSGKDHTPSRLALADAAIAAAARLQPNSGELHLLLAEHFYRGYLDYDHARAELALAQRTLPNNEQIFYWMALIDRRQGRWNESVRNFEKAMELDPGETVYLRNTAQIYELQRRFAEAAALLDRVLKLLPQDHASDEYDKREVRVERASIDLAWRADPRPLHVAIEAIVTEKPAAATEFPYEWFDLALCEHDPVTGNRALAAMKPGGLGSGSGESFPRAWFEGLAARARGDAVAARAAFESARVEAETTVREQPDYGPNLCVLGMIDAALGRKEDAIREGRRAVELLPVAKDSIAGAGIMKYLGIIYAWTGEKNLAIDQVAATLQIPSDLNYGKLRLHPFWDPLRGDPRFEKLVASLAPKPANK
jgi:serine/threonine protein kinase/cytochrome c-type biogenesis protein CcmH/NrfG